MSLLFKLQNIGFAISVGTLSVLAVNVEPAKANPNDPNYDWHGNAEALCQKIFQGRTMGMNMAPILQGALYTTKHPQKLQQLYYLSSQKCPHLW